MKKVINFTTPASFLPLIAVTLSLFYTTMCITWSMKYGRLAYDSVYDDVVYLIDAAGRLDTLQSKSLYSFLTTFWETPPHSPYSTILALISFVLFGLVDWAPYALNAITLFIFLYFLFKQCKNIHFGMSLWLVLLLLSFPLCLQSIVDFRPDFANGLFTALAIFSLANASDSYGDERLFVKQIRISALLFTAALLTKPTFFPHTIALAFVCVVSLLLADRLLKKPLHMGFETLGRKFLLLAKGIWPALIIIIAYGLLTWRHYWDYLRGSTGDGELAHIFAYHGGVLNTISQTLWKGSMSHMLLNVFPCILLVIILTLFFSRKQWSRTYIVTNFVTIGAMLASICILLYGKVDNIYFGATFQILTLFIMIWNINQYYNIRYVRWMIFLFAAVLTIVRIQLPLVPVSIEKTLDSYKASSRNREIVRIVEKNNWLNNTGSSAPSTVFFTFSGPVNARSCQWISIKNNLSLGFTDSLFEPNIDKVFESAKRSDIVVATQVGSSAMYPWLPEAHIQDTLSEMISTDDQFMQISHFPVVNGKMIYVFSKKIPHPENNGFEKNIDYTGFREQEGPYAQWALPVVRWSLGPTSSIIYQSQREQNAVLRLSVRGSMDRTLEIAVNGIVVGAWKISANQFTIIDIPVSLKKNKNTVKFSSSDCLDDSISVLFRCIRFIQ